MPPKLTWADSEEIAIALHARYPTEDPLTVRFTDLRQRVCALPDFGDDPAGCNERKLEAIQMAWLEEFRDAAR